jgi:metal-responsive CopG/Arc/MetJ family transcriptional regulator
MDTSIMAARSVQISLDEELLQRVDRDPDARRNGRSHLISAALRVYLEAKRRRDVDSAIRRAYSGADKALLREIEPLIRNQAWPDE